MPEFVFDESYYRRFYFDPKTRVGGAAERARLGRFVFAYLEFLDLPVRELLDLGCGTGLWRAPLRKRHPKAEYVGVEWSDWLCAKYGWTKGSAATYRSGRKFDLVVCQGVLQYLDDRQAEAAVRNFGKLCRGALYVEALTKRDWKESADRETTDGNVHLRTGEWYRRRLAKSFEPLGGGLFLRKGAPVRLFELERT